MRIDLNTLGVEFTFDAKMDRDSERVIFYKKLYGYKDIKKNYTYIKDGILSGMKYLKPTRSTIIVSVKDAKVIKSFFRKNKVDFNEKIVILNREEAKELGLSFPSNWHKIYEELKGSENLKISVDF